MYYYEVLVADGHYHSNSALTYSSDSKLPILSIVTVPLRQRNVTGFITSQLESPPEFKTKAIKSVLSNTPLPYHCLQLAQWVQQYYACSLAEALRQFAPSKPLIRRKMNEPQILEPQIGPAPEPILTHDQAQAIKSIWDNPSVTVLLHGDTGTGKTRVYMELAKKTLSTGKSVILLTPEISLTSQLLLNARRQLTAPIYVLHSQLSDAQRKKIWFQILEASEPVVVIGPRSALFSPVQSVGLVVLDEAHEPAYKQDQSPYYHAGRVASQLGILSGAKVILGTATPSVGDYYLAGQKSAIVRMNKPAKGVERQVTTEVLDLKDRSLFSKSSHFATKTLEAIKTTISANQQVLIYLNRRGSARNILCQICGWHLYCPNCDVPLIYHADQHLARCHICGYKKAPPVACPKCNNPEIIYRSIGTKALADEVARLFPDVKIARFDSDNTQSEQLHHQYSEILSGNIDILVGTQLLAKGLDLPKLGLVVIVSAETSLGLPDFTSEERSFQLIYQIAGRVGRGHGESRIIVQSYDPKNIVLNSALQRDYGEFYKHSLIERKQYKFPPFSYLLQLTCKRATLKGAENAASNLEKRLDKLALPVELIGPTPSFYARRGKYYYYQLVAKSKSREHLLALAQEVPADWQVNIDPANLL